LFSVGAIEIGTDAVALLGDHAFGEGQIRIGLADLRACKELRNAWDECVRLINLAVLLL
jgi:hypothetical protein